MMLSGHLLVAAGGYLIFKEYTSGGQWVPNATFVGEMALVLLGCLLPDIDHPDSTIGQRVRLLSRPISILFGHRGAFHSLAACCLILYVGTSYEQSWMKLIAAGYLLHLVGDYLTPSGIPLMYPSKKRYRFPIVAQTNSMSEHVVSFGVFVTGIYYALLA